MELSPFRRRDLGFAGLHDQLERLFQDFGMERARDTLQSRWTPTVDISEDDKNIVVKAELPGVPVADIDISLAHQVLTIQGEKREENDEKDRNYTRKERFHGTFRRSIPLPDGVDLDGVTAVERSGVLTITVPKAASAKATRVKVQSK